MASTFEDSKCVIETKDGPIRGYIEKTADRLRYKFKKIPYAKPPVGCLRFLPPCPVTPWTEELDCTKSGPPALSYCASDGGSEDCLYLEVSSPNIKPDKPLPVMFWIGCFRFCRNLNRSLDPVYINNENVILVCCEFRIGPFGFISINDFMAPGNCGLKDVVMALKWVQNNIGRFGGNPDNVTLFGNSAGGVIAHLMMLSPMATGLFHKAIIQSASALNNWSLDKNPSHSVMELAKQLGITKTCKQDVIEQLRNCTAIEITEAFYILEMQSLDFQANNMFDAIFKPCIEEEFEGQPAFLTKSPPLIIKSGNFNKVPVIFGSNNIESNLLEIMNTKFFSDFEKFNDNVHLLVPHSLAGEAKLSKRIGKQLLKFYLGGQESFTSRHKTQYLQLISDYYFLYYVNKTVRLHSQFSPEFPVYYYIINCVGEWNVPDIFQFFNLGGHCTELPFLFGLRVSNGPDYTWTADEPTNIAIGSRDSNNTRNRIVRMWTNFAKYGNPTPDSEDPLLQITWDSVENPDKLNYLSIGAELTKGRNPFHDRMEFWEELHKEHTFLRALVYFNDLGVSW